MIRHTKLTKSNVPILNKAKKKKSMKKIVSNCDTPKNIFSKSTSRNGSPNPSSTRNQEKLNKKAPKIKLSSTSPRLRIGSLYSYTSPINSLKQVKTSKKSKKSATGSKNLSPKHTERPENVSNAVKHREVIDLNDKLTRTKVENVNVNQLKLMLQHVIKENNALKNKLRKMNESQEEPKAIMNSDSIDILAETIKNKLLDLHSKFL